MKKSLSRKKNDAPPHVWWRHWKRYCASWHSTLGKPTPPHDANSVVQNKKGTKPKTKEENPKHAQRGWEHHTRCLLFLASSVRSRSGVFLQLSLEYSKSGLTAHPQVVFTPTGRSVPTRQRTSVEVGCVLNVATISDVPAAQVGSIGELGLPFAGSRRQSQDPHQRSYDDRSRTHRHKEYRGAHGRGSSRRNYRSIG